jgi:hypothetical protein
LAVARAAADPGAGRAPSLITKPASPSDAAPPPSSEFKDRLDRENAKTGDVQISLIWYNKNDLDLHCIDPDRYEISYRRPASPSGGRLDVDANGPEERKKPLTSEPVENIYWDKAPPGRYEVFVNYYRHRPEERAPNETKYKVSVLYGGKREEFTGTITNNGTTDNRRPIFEFQLYPRVEVFTPTEIELPLGGSASVPVALRRMYYQGPVEVKVENLPEGVAADPITVAERANDGTLTLKAVRSAKVARTGIKVLATGAEVTGTFDAELAVQSPKFSAAGVILIGVWTALLAVGLCLALLAGQNRYLGRPPFASGRVPLVLVILGAVAAGLVSGSVGQSLFSLLLSIGVGSLGLVIGWVLLGGLLGWGVSLFVPNLDRKKSFVAGLAGGLLGAVAYLVASEAANWLGRLAGAALLGFCIGLVVAVVEAAFRRAWLEVRYGTRETITVNLGPEPVKVGGDARACTVWARGAAPLALRFFVRDGQVICEDAVMRRETAVADGFAKEVGNVTVTVRTGSGTAATHSAPRPASPVPPKAASSAAPLSLDDDPLPLPMPTSRPAMPSAPVSPPPAPAAPKPAMPSVPAKPPAPGASKPAVPTAPPAAPKPAAPASPPAATPAAKHPDACPSCGRVNPGAKKSRYCVVCDLTY